MMQKAERRYKMNTLYRVLSWNCCGPKLEEIGKTEVTQVSDGVGVLYYKDGKKYLTPKQSMPYWDEEMAPYEYYFDAENGEMYMIVDEAAKEKWLGECQS